MYFDRDYEVDFGESTHIMYGPFVGYEDKEDWENLALKSQNLKEIEIYQLKKAVIRPYIREPDRVVFNEPIEEIDEMYWEKLRFVLEKINGPFIEFDSANLIYNINNNVPCNYNDETFNKPNTICIVRNEKNEVSGAYTDIEFKEEEGELKGKGNTFLFEMTKDQMTKYPFNPKDSDAAEITQTDAYDSFFAVGNDEKLWKVMQRPEKEGNNSFCPHINENFGGGNGVDENEEQNIFKVEIYQLINVRHKGGKDKQTVKFDSPVEELQ